MGRHRANTFPQRGLVYRSNEESHPIQEIKLALDPTRRAHFRKEIESEVLFETPFLCQEVSTRYATLCSVSELSKARVRIEQKAEGQIAL